MSSLWDAIRTLFKYDDFIVISFNSENEKLPYTFKVVTKSGFKAKVVMARVYDELSHKYEELKEELEDEINQEQILEEFKRMYYE